MKIILLICCCAVYSCTNSVKSDATSNQHEFFPVNIFIENEIRLVNSFKLPTRKYTTIDNRTDSVLISLHEFDSLAAKFLNPNFNDPSIRDFYKETSFADQSIPGVTFTYSTLNKDLSVQRIDVILDSNPVSFEQVNSIYLEKAFKRDDIAVYEKLYWKRNRYFQIISRMQSAGQPATSVTVKVTWTAE